MSLEQTLQKEIEDSELWLGREKENQLTNENLGKGLNY